jgi:hypothetical protein
MARRSISAISADFDQVFELLSERKILPENADAALVQIARSIHSATYSLILWKFRLKKLPLHAQVFIEEIASDALQILPQILMGYSKTAKLLTRGVLENTLRHVYFSDHPIEFIRMNREQRWFLTIENLCEYAKAHPRFLITEPKFDALAQMTSLYSTLSAGVHGRTVRDLEMRNALSKIAYDAETAAIDARHVSKCAQAVNFVLSIFHRNQMGGFQIEDQRLILRTLPAQARQIWSEFDPAEACA